jgi:flagellar basal-body rod protein FlgF
VATGMWTSVSGAAAQSQAVDLVANNLANADTNGFKKDGISFKEYLSTAERENDMPQIHHGPIQDKHLNPILDKDQSHVVAKGTFTNFKQGPMKVTKSPLDVALEGPGMIEVSTPQGIRFTRLGAFKIAADGKLVTNEGYPVLSAQAGGATVDSSDSRAPASLPADDSATLARVINVSDRGPLSFTEAGEIYSEGNLIGKISVVEFQDPKWVRKSGLQYYENKNPEKSGMIAASNTKLHQGMLEGSNVNPIEEMANLIKANRLFEHDMKVMRTYNDIMGKEANDIGKL